MKNLSLIASEKNYKFLFLEKSPEKAQTVTQKFDESFESLSNRIEELTKESSLNTTGRWPNGPLEPKKNIPQYSYEWGDGGYDSSRKYVPDKYIIQSDQYVYTDKEEYCPSPETFILGGTVQVDKFIDWPAMIWLTKNEILPRNIGPKDAPVVLEKKAFLKAGNETVKEGVYITTIKKGVKEVAQIIVQSSKKSAGETQYEAIIKYKKGNNWDIYGFKYTSQEKKEKNEAVFSGRITEYLMKLDYNKDARENALKNLEKYTMNKREVLAKLKTIQQTSELYTENLRTKKELNILASETRN